MSKSFPLPTEPEGVIPSLIERFNSGKVEAMMALYAPEAVVVAKDGRTITDRNEIAAQFQRDMSFGLPLKANVRHVFVGDDTAQIVVDWSIDGKGPNRGCSPWRLGKRYRAPRRGWILAVPYRQ
jgi:ketosteroid isomerase-like protein